MTLQVKDETVESPEGDEFRVSSIRTSAGGAPDKRSLGNPFKLSDYVGENPWPFEVMVFQGGCTGVYHEAHSTEEEVLKAHERIAGWIREGQEFPSGTVRDPFGVPALTPEEWYRRSGK